MVSPSYTLFTVHTLVAAVLVSRELVIQGIVSAARATPQNSRSRLCLMWWWTRLSIFLCVYAIPT